MIGLAGVVTHVRNRLKRRVTPSVRPQFHHGADFLDRPFSLSPGLGPRRAHARSRAPSSKRASPEEPASPARAGRNRGT